MTRTKQLRWARSEYEAATLQAQGWQLAQQCLSTHHHRYALLLEMPEGVHIPQRDTIATPQPIRTRATCSDAKL